MSRRRRLLVLLGDQLDRRLLEHAGFERGRDAVVMMEAAEEARHVPSHRQRTALFLAAMRHFADELEADGVDVVYRRLDDPDNAGTLGAELGRVLRRLEPETVTLVRPGEWRVLHALAAAADEAGCELRRLEDPHFLTSPADFADWAEGRREVVLEHFYRWTRKRLGLLLDDDGRPVGGRWNFDRDNRQALGADGPDVPPPLRFEPDGVTREVLDLVARTFPDAPGRLDSFGWPVTREQALEALDDFVAHRLRHFGDYQDAMRAGEPWLFHSLLSPALNLHLIDPREVVSAAVDAYERGDAPINAVEGFVRQIVGWRELIRGVYWHLGPDYGERNGLDEHGRLPELYWTGDTDMACLADAFGQVLEHGYGHHIQRLMVTGNFALLAGVHPRAVSDWYLGMYVDAVEWVTLPNTLGMVMHADGGVVGTKPYAASGRYIERMGDFCASCPYDPGERTGDGACPFTTLYWDFLLRQRSRLEGNRRMALMWKHVDRMDADEQAAVRERAGRLRAELGVE